MRKVAPNVGNGLKKRTEIPAFIISLDGTILSCNATAAERFGHDGANTVGRPCHEVLGCSRPSSDGCVRARVLKSMKKESGRILKGADKYEEVVEPLFDGSGKLNALTLHISHTVGIAASDLAKLHRLEGIAQATSGIVHDLNNIFTRICGGISLLKLKAEADHSIVSDPLLGEIEIAGEQGCALAAQLLGFGRGDSPGRSIVSLDDSIHKAVAFSTLGSKRPKPAISIETGIWPIYANPEQIKQLVSNLTINAVQATKGTDAAIHISADNVDNKTAGDLGLPAVKHVRIAIRDEGPGILPEHLGHLFQPFFTTKKDGTGLGLTLAALIVEEHGGRITVESESGRGTTFTIYLPVARTEAGDPSDLAQSLRPSQNK